MLFSQLAHTAGPRHYYPMNALLAGPRKGWAEASRNGGERGGSIGRNINGRKMTPTNQQRPLLAAEVQAALKEFVSETRALYGPRFHSAILYGSMARGDGAVPGSDVDVLLVLEGAVEPVEEIWRCLKLTARISLEHELVLAPVFMSRHRYETGASPLLLNVRREGIPL